MGITAHARVLTPAPIRWWSSVAARLLFLLAIIAICGGPMASKAQAAPGNDAFASAQILSGSGATASGTNVLATKEAGEPNHNGNAGGASVWYSWTAPANIAATVDTF